MKWIGIQSIYDTIRFNEPIILDADTSSITIDGVTVSTVQESGESFVDNDTSLMTSAAIDDRINTAVTAEDLDLTADSGTAAVDLNSQALAVTGGTGITTSATGQAVTINVDASLTGLTTIGAAGATTNFAAGDLTMYNAVNDGNPTISLGSTANDRLLIEAEYNSGAQTLNEINFKTSTASSTANDGRMIFHIDDVQILAIRDAGINFQADMGISIAGTDILTDSSGTATLSNIDALDATTESTIESAIDTLGNLTSIGTIGTGVWQGTAIASAYLDADTAHYSAQKQLTYYMFRADIDTTKTYIGLQEADGESTSATNKNLPILAPVAGKLLKVFLRANSDLSGNELTWRLETRASSASTSGTPSVVGTVSESGCTASSMTTYDFTSPASGDNIIDAGDTVQLSIQSDAATANTKFHVTCLWEWDRSSIG